MTYGSCRSCLAPPCGTAVAPRHVHQVATISLHVVGEHLVPARAHDGHLDPARTVPPDDVRRIAPEVVVAEAHRRHVAAASPHPENLRTSPAQWDAAAATELLGGVLAASADFHVFWAAQELHCRAFPRQEKAPLPLGIPWLHLGGAAQRLGVAARLVGETLPDVYREQFSMKASGSSVSGLRSVSSTEYMLMSLQRMHPSACYASETYCRSHACTCVYNCAQAKHTRLRTVSLFAKRHTMVKARRSTDGPMSGMCSRSRSQTAAM